MMNVPLDGVLEHSKRFGNPFFKRENLNPPKEGVECHPLQTSTSLSHNVWQPNVPHQHILDQKHPQASSCEGAGLPSTAQSSTQGTPGGCLFLQTLKAFLGMI